MAVRGLFLPAHGHAEWLSDFISEVLAFPAGRNDDRSTAFQFFASCWTASCPAEAPVKKEPPKVLSLDPAIPSTVTMNDLWAEQDRKYRRGGSRRI